MLVGMMQSLDNNDEEKGRCPLRRVQLWHVIPLCLLAIVNLLLIILALLGLAGYRIVVGLQSLIIAWANADIELGPYTQSVVSQVYALDGFVKLSIKGSRNSLHTSKIRTGIR